MRNTQTISSSRTQRPSFSIWSTGRLSVSLTRTTQPSNTVHTREYPQRAITTASVAVQPTHMADHTQHLVAANATSQEGSLTMHIRTPPEATTTLQVKNEPEQETDQVSLISRQSSIPNMMQILRSRADSQSTATPVTMSTVPHRATTISSINMRGTIFTYFLL